MIGHSQVVTSARPRLDVVEEQGKKKKNRKKKKSKTYTDTSLATTGAILISEWTDHLIIGIRD